MPPRKWIDRKNATTYKLVHRPQNDPLIHDASASSMVFQELDAPQASKKAAVPSSSSLSTSTAAQHSGTTLSELADELRTDRRRDDDGDGPPSLVSRIRANEGEAAEHGVYYDDTEYDYMQHLRDLGTGEGQSTFVEAVPTTVGAGKGKSKSKGKGISLDEALKTLDISRRETEELQKTAKLEDESILPSRNLKRVTYQDQQDVPDALRGFQPDMDWRLREALEALEDEAYVDNTDQDLFDMLAADGEEIDDDEFEDSGYYLGESDDHREDYDDDGWESDNTAQPDEGDASDDDGADDEHEIKHSTSAAGIPSGELPAPDASIPDAPSDPLAAFHAHKAQKAAETKPAAKPGAGVSPSVQSALRGDRRMHDGAAASTVLTSASFMSGRRKKRRGAQTNPSAYSMTSSALARTEGQTLLDARFDRVLETQYEVDEFFDEDDAEWGNDDDTASVLTGVTDRASVVSKSVNSGDGSRSGAAPAASLGPPGGGGPAAGAGGARRDYAGVMDMMDEFLGGWQGGPAQAGDANADLTAASAKLKKRGGKTRRGYGGQTGMQQLDEIRRELGRPRLADVR